MAVIAIAAIAPYFFLPAFLCSARSAHVHHLVLLYMNDFEILSLGCFSFFFGIFQLCFCARFFTFCLPAVTELTFHFYFRVVLVFMFFCFFVSV